MAGSVQRGLEVNEQLPLLHSKEDFRENHNDEDTVRSILFSDVSECSSRMMNTTESGSLLYGSAFRADNAGEIESLVEVSCEPNETEVDATYWNLLSSNRSFRIFFASYLITNAGEWFTLVASVEALKKINSESNMAVSTLFILRLVPFVLLTTFGGALADALDKRHIMIFLDLSGMLAVLVYLPASQLDSLALLYVAVLIQSTLAALYEPAKSAILPMLVPQENCLKKATTLCGVAWSCMQAIGAFLGGVIVSTLGIRWCFKLDSITYFISAFLLWLIGGRFNAYHVGSLDKKTAITPSSVLDSYVFMTRSGICYLRTCGFGSYVLFKASGGLIWGATETMNVEFSHRDDDVAGDSQRLGILYSCVGFACLIGPLIADYFTDMESPRTLQGACIVSLALVTIGFAGWGIWNSSFPAVCLFTIVRACGSSTVWIHSTLLLQKFTPIDMLGRVMSVDLLLATLFSAFSLGITGFLQDLFQFSATNISWTMTLLGSMILGAWCIFHFRNTEGNALRNTDNAPEEK